MRYFWRNDISYLCSKEQPLYRVSDYSPSGPQNIHVLALIAVVVAMLPTQCTPNEEVAASNIGRLGGQVIVSRFIPILICWINIRWP